MNKLTFTILTAILFGSSGPSWAQTVLKELTVEYNLLRLDKGYSILYDNTNETAKLNTFKIEFFNYSEYVGETNIESFPFNGTIATYGLAESIVGFNKAKLSIISLHSGGITDLPSSAASIIALNEPTKLDPVISINKPPIAKDELFEIEATNEILTRSIANQYFDLDNDVVTVVEISEAGPPLSYNLSPQGQLTLTAPSITGSNTFAYTVRDSKGADATAQISVNVILPESLTEFIGTKKTSLDVLKGTITELETNLKNHPQHHQDQNDTLTQLAGEIDTSILRAETNIPIKSQLESLRQELDQVLAASNQQNLLLQIESLQTQITALDKDLSVLASKSQSAGTDITELTTSLSTFGAQMDTIDAEIDRLELPIPLTAAQIARWQAQHQTLKNRIPTSFDWRWPLGALLALLGVAGVSIGTRKKHKPVLTNFHLKERSVMPKINKGDLSNLSKKIPTVPVAVELGINPRHLKNPILPVNVVEPGTTGKVRIPPSFSNLALNVSDLGGPRPKMEHGKVFAASSSSQITHQLLNPQSPSLAMPHSNAVTHAPAGIEIEEVYRAVGRVGGSSINGEKDRQKSFGTACLITPNHVMTNRHVSDNELYFGEGDDNKWTVKELLMYGGDWGIEFMALEDSDESIFVECDDSEPIILDGLDIAIFRLKEEVSKISPVKLSLIDEHISETENVIVIGYPDHWYRSDFDNTFNAFEDDPLLAVKRVSRGPLIHDEDLPEVYTHDVSGTLPVIYHRATTLGGNSGSPVLDAVSNQVIGIHFQAIDAEVIGIVDDDENPGYNLAMPINEIINKLPCEIRHLIETT